MNSVQLDQNTIARIDAASGQAPILVALSGGGDSVALLHLMAERLGARRLQACTIDHGLRASAAADAAAAARIAGALGVQCEIVKLAWPGGVKRSQAAARAGRYAALCETARRVNAAVIAAAHTRDDQAETVLMRAASGSSWRGLAGIAAFAPAPVWPEGRGLWLARPLLGARRADLRAMLRARGADWIEDPSNENTAFARVRLRKRLAALGRVGFEPMRLAELAERLRPLAERLDEEALALIARAARFEAEEAVIVPASWSGSELARRRALSALIAAAAGALHEPSPEAVAALEGRLGPAFRGATLGGARLRRSGGTWRLSRDTGALHGRAGGVGPLAPLALPQDAEIVWDGRLALTVFEPGWRAESGAESGAPVLQRDGERLACAEALRCGRATARWLIEDHVRHLLPVHLAVRASVAQ